MEAAPLIDGPAVDMADVASTGLSEPHPGAPEKTAHATSPQAVARCFLIKGWRSSIINKTRLMDVPPHGLQQA